MRNRQRGFAVVIADDEVRDVDARLKAAPMRRQLADGELRVQLVGDSGLLRYESMRGSTT